MNSLIQKPERKPDFESQKIRTNYKTSNNCLFRINVDAFYI